MRRAIVAVILVATAAPAGAHGMRTASIEIAQSDATHARIRIRSKVPVSGLEVTAGAPCEISTTETGTWLACPHELAGARLTVVGFGPIASDAVVFLTALDGSSTSASITPRDPTWTIPGGADEAMLDVAARYVRLGIEHIATGADHLLFLLALVLCLRTLRAVMLAETAFTLSHTLSFTASSLGWLRVPAAAAEACIAASLILIAFDAGRTTREPAWKTAALAFAFGLVHGLGFAGGLAEIGLPASAIPAALVGFAGGVELGQVAFLLVAVALLALAGRIPRVARATVTAGALAVGGIGSYWLFVRLTCLH